jgi:GT2 family glycosyltransferase
MSFSIIIPSRNAANLVPCIRAIREAGETARIIVVDDGDLVAYNYSVGNEEGTDGIEYVEGVKPFVFARNVNIGIRTAGDDDVVILNDDALLKTPMGFSIMSRPPEWMPGYGVIAAACNTVGNERQFRREGNRLREESRMVCFVCVYIPRSTINTVGLIDERFVDYGCEDDDYCLRVRNVGLKIGIFDGCFVDHSSLKSSFRGDAGAGGNFEPNLKRFIEKWGVDNRNYGRDRSNYRHLFPWPRCEHSFHFHRCTLSADHSGEHNLFPGSVPEHE